MSIALTRISALIDYAIDQNISEYDLVNSLLPECIPNVSYGLILNVGREFYCRSSRKEWRAETGFCMNETDLSSFVNMAIDNDLSEDDLRKVINGASELDFEIIVREINEQKSFRIHTQERLDSINRSWISDFEARRKKDILKTFSIKQAKLRTL